MSDGTMKKPRHADHDEDEECPSVPPPLREDTSRYSRIHGSGATESLLVKEKSKESSTVYEIVPVVEEEITSATAIVVAEPSRALVSSHEPSDLEEMSISTEDISPPPPLEFNRRNVSRPGAFRVSVTSSSALVHQRIEDDDSSSIASSIQESSLEFPRTTTRFAPVRYSESFVDEGQEDAILLEASLVTDTFAEESPTNITMEGNNEIVELEASATCEKTVDLVEAKPVKSRFVCCICIMITLTFVGVIIGAVLGMNVRPVSHFSSQNIRTSDISIFTTTSTPTSAPTASPDFYYDILPESVRQSMEEDASSPPSRAYQWLISDPHFGTYSILRQKQRFFLATIYFALHGEWWTKNDNWLSYNHHECDWYSDERTGRGCDGDHYEVFHLDSANMSGTIPEEISFLTSLVKLDLSHNNLKGSLPTHLSKLTNLRELNLDGNSISGPLPSDFVAVRETTQFDLVNSIVTTTTSSGFDNLLFVSFQNNQLNGMLPNEMFSDWGWVNHINFQNNALSGTLSPNVGKLNKLKILDLSTNKLNGTLPTNLGELTAATHLYLKENRFTGTIPSSLGYLTNLEVLWLHGNLLSGTVPDTLCKLLESGKLQDLSIDCFYVQCHCGCSCQYIYGD